MRKTILRKTCMWTMLPAVIMLGLMAQEAKKVMTLDECIDLGLKYSKRLQAEEMNVEISTAKSKEIDASRLPSLKFSGGYTRLSQVPDFVVHLPFPPSFQLPNKFVVSPNYFDNYSMRFTLQQPIFTGFRLEATSKMARLAVRAAEQEFRNNKDEMAYRIKNAYWNLFKALEFKKLVDENLTQIERHLEDVRNFFDQGLLTKNEVLKSQVQLSSVRLAQLDAANGIELAAVWLNNLIGSPLDAPIEPAAKVEELEAAAHETLETEEHLEGLLDRALSLRADLKAMDFRAKAGEAGVKAAGSGGYPQVFLIGSYYDLRPNPRLLPAQNKFYSTWDLNINVSWDLWNWGATLRQKQQAKARLSQIRNELGQMKDAAAVEIRQAWLAVKRGKEKIRLAGEAVLEAQENLRITEDRFKEGVALNSEVLDAEAAHLQAKTNYTQALVDLELAKAALTRAVGESE